MEQFSFNTSHPRLRKAVMGNKPLLRLWRDTQDVIPNAHLVILQMAQIQSAIRIDLARTCYAALIITPLSAQDKENLRTDRNYAAVIAVADDYTPSDIAHELAHLFVHGSLGFPWLWDQIGSERVDRETWTKRNFLARICDVAIHPTVDKVVEDYGLLTGIRERLYADCKDVIKQHLRNPSDSQLNWTLLRVIELRQRLTPQQWTKILLKFSHRTSFEELLAQERLWPTYPSDLTPESATKYIDEMIRIHGFTLDNLKFQLVSKSPLLVSYTVKGATTPLFNSAP
ncbi:MAG: hypothetical protein QMC81_02880 [Thermoanaerobacterales bacterium]|nr:hypothetical protein [Thermoanaerobacterales bacterium]